MFGKPSAPSSAGMARKPPTMDPNKLPTPKENKTKNIKTYMFGQPSAPSSAGMARKPHEIDFL